MPKKCILILLDGLGDRSFECLDHQTPLQAAHTPVLNKIAEMGANGLYHAGLLGQALPSENAHFAMFGYGPDDFPGRGALEALGADIPLQEDEVAVLGHLVSVHEENGGLIYDVDRPRVSAAERDAFLNAVANYRSGNIEVRFVPTKDLFGIIVLKGDVAPFVTDSNPMWEGQPVSEILPWASHASDAKTCATAAALKDYLLWVHHTLSNHPLNVQRREQGTYAVNGMVSQRAGRMKQVQPIGERYGLRALSISSGIIYRGISQFLGFHSRKVQDSDDPAADIAERLNIAREALPFYDFVHVHSKVPDEAAHAKNPQLKKDVIEALDRGIGKAIEPLINDPKVILMITSDHSTPSTSPLIHSGEPVPLTIFGQGVRRDAVRRFDEIQVAGGALGMVRGGELMHLVLNHLDRSKLVGIMDTPHDQPYWPGRYHPFQVK